MGVFRYQCLSKTGISSKGVIEADSLRQARQLLHDRGVILIEINEVSKLNYHRRNKLSPANLALFTRQLATLLAAGIPVEEALNGVGEQIEQTQNRSLIMSVRTKVLQGFAFAQALGEFPYAFPELYRATIGAGEHTGRLDTVLEKLADYTEHQQLIRQKIHQALIYPILMILVSTTIISFLLAFIVPKIIDVFTSSGQSLPIMTTLLITISALIKHHGLYLLATFTVVVVIFKRQLKHSAVKIVWHRILLKIPLITYLIRTTNVARYLHTFAILFAAGVNVLETMRVAASVVNNQVMRMAFDTAIIRVREGTGISLALKESGFLNPMAGHLIASGEKSGQIATMMARAAFHMDNEVKRLVDTGLTLLEPLVILLMGVVVLFIVLATLLPIFSMEQLVN